MSKESKNIYNELNLLLGYSYKIYAAYLKSEKQFRYAKMLYEVNRQIYELLIQNAFQINQDVSDDVIELLLHLDVWSSIWEEEFEAQSPSSKDVFTFGNDVKFPKESVKRLLKRL